MSKKLTRIKSYLTDQIDEGKSTYVKSKAIAASVNLSAKEVGHALPRLDDDDEFDVEKWAYSTSTTWKVTRNPSA